MAIRTVTLLSLSLLSAPAWTQETITDDEGLYFGGRLGTANYSEISDAAAYRSLDVGYRALGGRLAVEAGVGETSGMTRAVSPDSDDFDSLTTRNAFEAQSVRAMARIPMQGGMAVLAGLGYHDVEMDATLAGEDFTVSDERPSAIVGAEFDMEAVELRAWAERIDLDAGDLTTIGLGLGYRF